MNKSNLRHCAFLLFFLLLWQGCLAAGPAEAEVRRSLVDQTTRLWAAKDYRALDALAAEYTANRSRTPSGLWKIGYMAAVLNDQTNFDGDDKAWAAVMEERVLAWPKMAPKSAMARIQVAAALRNRAWKKRGQGWAREVPPESWKAFKKYVEQARIYLETTKSVSATAMPWYGQMFEIAMLQSWPEQRVLDLLQEAMARDREYFPMYFAVIDYYSPRWGGSTAKVETIASKIASAFPAVQGDILYARMYWWAADTHFEAQLVDSNVDCPRMLRGMTALADEFPDLWNINRFASFAIDCGDKVEARKYFDQIGNNPQVEAWNGDLRNFHKFRAIAYSKD
jgi:hypothetical protein